MKLKIGTLTIEQFRVFRKLTIEGLGRVNLITGRNNTGKSSVLEALRILASDAAPHVLYRILLSREENEGEVEEPYGPVGAKKLFPMSNLFHDFPEFSAEIAPIVIASNDGERPLRLTIKPELFSEEWTSDGSRKLVPLKEGSPGTSEALPVLVVETGGARRILPLDYSRLHPSTAHRLWVAEESGLPYMFVSPYGGEQTAPLGYLWDRTALSDSEKDVIDALGIIDPTISAVSMIGGEGPRQTRIAIVRAKGISRPVPLRTFGDGLNRLFGIVLSLVNAKDGLLLIDEFENGMHYTVQADTWRAIFKLASRLDVQVVATSHSWDAVEAFQKAASEDPEEGVLIRLSRKGDDIVPTLFREDELAIATRDRIEVR
jgi:hypothetical protein